MIKNILIGIGLLASLSLAEVKTIDNKQVKEENSTKVIRLSGKAINDFADLTIKKLFEVDHKNLDSYIDQDYLNLFNLETREDLKKQKENLVNLVKKNEEFAEVTLFKDNELNKIELVKDRVLLIQRVFNLIRIYKTDAEKNLYEAKGEVVVIQLLVEPKESISKEYPHGMAFIKMYIVEQKEVYKSSVEVLDK